MKKNLTILALIYTAVGNAVAEVSQYTLGQFLTDLIDVIGFNFLDSLAAIKEVIYLGLLLILLGVWWKVWKRK